jgi:hypothetical protein
MAPVGPWRLAAVAVLSLLVGFNLCHLVTQYKADAVKSPVPDHHSAIEAHKVRNIVPGRARLEFDPPDLPVFPCAAR